MHKFDRARVQIGRISLLDFRDVKAAFEPG